MRRRTSGCRCTRSSPNSPAAQAGIESGDGLVAINGQRFQFLTGSTMLEELRAHAGETVVLTIDDADGTRRDVEATLRTQAEIDAGQGALGINRAPEGWQAHWFGEYTTNDPATAIQLGWSQTTNALGLILGGLGTLAGSVAADPTAPPPVSGPVGIATQIGDIFWNAGPIMTLYVAGILSANLAVVNVLPFPPLDGGRMLMITLKALFGRRISLRAEQMTYAVGFVFLFAFLIWITGFDILRQLGGGT